MKLEELEIQPRENSDDVKNDGDAYERAISRWEDEGGATSSTDRVYSLFSNENALKAVVI